MRRIERIRLDEFFDTNAVYVIFEIVVYAGVEQLRKIELVISELLCKHIQGNVFRVMLVEVIENTVDDGTDKLRSF